MTRRCWDAGTTSGFLLLFDRIRRCCVCELGCGRGAGPQMRRGFSQWGDHACLGLSPHLSPGTSPASLVRYAFQSISSSVYGRRCPEILDVLHHLQAPLKCVNVIVCTRMRFCWAFLKFFEDFLLLGAAKLKGRYRHFSCTNCSHINVASFIIHIAQRSGMFVTNDQPTWAHRSHPKSSLHQGALLVLCVLWVSTNAWWRIFTYILVSRGGASLP